jgi:hypothetical protein
MDTPPEHVQTRPARVPFHAEHHHRSTSRAGATHNHSFRSDSTRREYGVVPIDSWFAGRRIEQLLWRGRASTAEISQHDQGAEEPEYRDEDAAGMVALVPSLSLNLASGSSFQPNSHIGAAD